MIVECGWLMVGRRRFGRGRAGGVAATLESPHVVAYKFKRGGQSSKLRISTIVEAGPVIAGGLIKL